MKLHYFISLLLLLTGCNKNEETSDILQADLTTAEIENLNFLREEEKLARDVYLYAYDRYDLNIFKNISSSEQTHMDKVLELLNTYSIEDFASSERGVFNNPELAATYTSLIAKVDQSLTDALTVGATIEDLDLYDINRFLNNTENSDLKIVFESLKCGSQNHMRAFNRQLISLGISYEAQYISDGELQEILAGQNGGCGI